MRVKFIQAFRDQYKNNVIDADEEYGKMLIQEGYAVEIFPDPEPVEVKKDKEVNDDIDNLTDKKESIIDKVFKKKNKKESD